MNLDPPPLNEGPTGKDQFTTGWKRSINQLYAYVRSLSGSSGSGITALTGDVSATGPGSAVATLATVNSAPGTVDNAKVTVNAKGLVTAAVVGSALTGLTGAVVAAGPGVSGSAFGPIASDTMLANATGGVASPNAQPIGALLDIYTSSPAFSATPTLAPADVIYFGVLTANVTAFNISGSKPRVQVWFTQNGAGGFTVTAGTSIEFGTDIPNLTGIAGGANASTLIGFNYNPITGKYRVVAIAK